MSSSALMSIGTRAMAASYAALQTTGNNIANANTVGYSRQQVELATAGGMYTCMGFFGRGVDVTTVSRAHDAFLVREAALTQSIAASDSARLAQLEQLEQIFGTGEAGLGYQSAQLLNAFVDVASRPQDPASRQVALARAQDAAAAFRNAGSQIETLQAGVAADLKTSVKAVNVLAQTVADLNRQIANAIGTGHTPNDLLDQRDQAVAEIGQYVQVTTIAADDGSLNLFIGGGQRLVLGTDVSTLVAMPDVYDPSQLHLGVSEGGKTRLVPDATLGGGSIAGLLRFQNEDLRDARNLVGQMAAALAGAVNTQQSLGLDLTTPTGRQGTDLFAVGAPRVQPASTNAGNAAVTLGTADATLLRASDYELRYDGSNYALTRLGSSDPVQTFTPAALAAGVTVDGMTIQLASGSAAAGDRFRLQPVAAAATQMQRLIDDPRGIAAASPVTATLGVANSGTAAIASLDVVAPIAVPVNAVVKFGVNPMTGETTYQLSADGGSTYGAAQPFVAGQPIAFTDGGGTTLWELSVTGAPADGDLIQVDPTAVPATSNGNALAMVALRDTAIVGGATVTDAWSSALAEVGVRVQGAQGVARMSAAVASDAAARATAVSGVNLDEEAARLIQYQQSYQAAAKMLQVAQSVFDTLLEVTSR
ncbi:MAG: flagellar hook-associated protein FlgK [Burkholderiaceae bacterium]|nr:flagellar hook-associated protein FlgK [Burkholderiaceae bacterium]